MVGEAPGGSEEETGKHFTGSAGRLLTELLEEVGLKRDWFFATNAVKCRPMDNGQPTASEVRTCVASFLIHEMDVVRPHYGLALGNGGLQATYGKKGITAMNGQVYEALGTTWVAALHPAMALRNPRYRQPLRQALLILSRLIKNEEGVPVTEGILVNDKASLQTLIAEMESHEWGSLDVETWSPHPGHGRFPGGGLAWWDDDFHLVSINFSFRPGYGYVLPLYHKQARWKDYKKVLEILKPYIENTKWVMHNGKYDSKCLVVSGIDAYHSFDTMGATYALDENNLKSLGFLSQVHLAAPDYKDMVDKTNLPEAPLNALVEYGARDSDYTFRLKSIMERRLKSEPLSERLFTKLLHPADVVLTSVELTGLPLHRRKLEVRHSQTLANRDESLDRVHSFAGWEVNLNSPKQVGDLLFNQIGLPVVNRTRTGAPSTAEDVIVMLEDYADEEQLPILKAILDYRLWDGYGSRYFKAWKELMDSKGRLHPHFKPYHTVTGRLSSEHPNAQQIPRDVFIRGIVGGRKGWKIIEADYSQVELRIVAHYTQDKAMLRAFNTGRDIHLETAMAVTGLSEPEITSEIRKKAKAVNFGFVYGMGARKFQTYAKTSYGISVSESEAQATRKAYFDLFRGLQPWHQRQRSAAKRRGWVVSSIGRKRHLHDIESTNEDIRAEAERQAINSPVQSMASDMMLMAMIILQPQLDPTVARIISTVHDSILFEIREEAVDDLLPLIVQTMENLPLEEWFDCILTVPIITDVKIGDFWSEGAVELNRDTLVY